ncbi:MAG: acyltransferase [Byssovorax sp.]
MNKTRMLVVAAALIFPVTLAACPNKDKDKEGEAPSAAVSVPPPVTVSAPPASAVITPEVDAGSDAADASDADADAKVVSGPSNLAKCCAAIAQNAKSAPPEQAFVYAAAVAACKSGAIPPQFRSLAPCK